MGIPTDPPNSRTIDYGALVRKAWGNEWHKHEKVYAMGGGRTFESSDYGTSGVYRAPSAINYSGTAAGGGTNTIILGTDANGVWENYVGKTITATWNGLSQSRAISRYEASSRTVEVSTAWDAPTFYLEFPYGWEGRVGVDAGIGGVSPTFTRSTKAWTRDPNGNRVEVPPNVPRAYYGTDGTYLGYLAEGARTNHFLNSDAPANQTSPSLGTATYCLWIEGSGSVAVAGNSATITGAGTATAGAPVTFVVTSAGTVDYTVSGSPTFVQSENGAFASTWIPTTSAAVTRNADVLTYPTTGWLSSTAGTVICRAKANTNASSVTAALGILSLDDSTNNERLGLYRETSDNWQLFSIDGGSQNVNLNVGNWAVGADSTGGFAYAANDFVGCVDGGTVVTDSAASLPTLSFLRVGSAQGLATSFSPILRVAYFNTRRTDADLQALTGSSESFHPYPDSATTYTIA